MAVQYTTVPYMWRRHLGMVRALLGIAAAILFGLEPVDPQWLMMITIGGFTLYACYRVVWIHVETTVFPMSLLILDLLFFLICTLHPSARGMWLSSVYFFFLLCEGALMYPWKAVGLVTLVSLAFLTTVRPIPAVMLWPTVLLGGALTTMLAIQKRSLEDRLSQALKRSVIARYEAETAREAERQRIAADFHDGPLQSFVSFQLRLEIIRKLLARDGEKALRELLTLQELSKTQLTELRTYIRSMQPVEVDRAGLLASLREMISHFERDAGIHAALRSQGDLTFADPATSVEVLQIVREALNNVRKHSKASRVTIVVERNGSELDIVVEDDGSGFSFGGAYTLDELDQLRLGPRSIKRRVRGLHGEMVLESRPGHGAELRVRIPV